MNQEPIFIFGPHKSGTSLLRNIFNGHSELYTMPIETHFFQNMKYWVDNEYRRTNPDTLSRNQILKSFYKAVHGYNTSDDIYSDSISKGVLDEEIFRKTFATIKKNDAVKIILEKYFASIYKSDKGKILEDGVRVVEKSVENAEFAYELQKFYPKAKFIHIIRNPYANIVSMRKYKSVDLGYPLIYRIIRTLYNSYFFLYKNKEVIKHYKVVRYEDLVFDPRNIVEEICEYLNIDFEDILLKPTYRGQPWKGNSITDKKFNKISPDRLGEWKEEIHPMEILYINQLFNFILDDYGYQKLETKGSFWSPAKGESLKRYLVNRIYRFYMKSQQI